MKLSELIKGVESCKICGNADVEVCDIAYNTSGVTRGACFVAMKGEKADGHSFIEDAIKRGATVIVSERPIKLGKNVVGVIVKNSRKALALMSAAFFGQPSKEMTLVGVTGTNGKTTITYLMESIFKAAGKRTGVIGTVEYRFCDVVEPAPHTTPESYELQKLLLKMRETGIDLCAMEVSSHALVQDRVAGCEFDAAVFTNLTPEHLDYHSDMESYFAAKAVLFEELLATSGKKGAFAAINVDDAYGAMLAKRCPVPAVLYGFGEDANVHGFDLEFDSNGLRMKVDSPFGRMECTSKLCGRFNAENILAATAVALRMGVPAEVVINAVSELPIVPGRFESVKNEKGILALVDYAHTPDAIENVLSNARELAATREGRLIVVFGCGGDRDRGKRPLMGRAAARLADVQIVTSDNPRTEEPQAIIDEIMPGVKEAASPRSDNRGYEVIPDRRKAIVRAIDIARKEDVVVVAGKGHEDYQIIGTKKMHFDDREVLREIFKGRH